MKILFFGAGPLGSVYAHLLHEKGGDVTILARGERYDWLKENGLVILLLSFRGIAIVLWRATGNIFLLFNFGYIGTAVGLGIGLYMLFFLGIFKMENMQIEGFF